MTDKQIIINGVNVDECKHYEDHTLYDCNETCEMNGGIVCTKCEDNSNCYYKQLKRKEQECEELKDKYKWYDHYKEQALYNKNLCNEKSEQLDQLKGENVGALKQLEFVRTLNTVQEVEIRNLKQTLTEIKEIAETISQPMGTGKSCNRVILANQILQKISECEVEL